MNWPRAYGYVMFGAFIILTFILPPTPPITRIEQAILVTGAGVCFAMATLPQEKKEVEK